MIVIDFQVLPHYVRRGSQVKIFLNEPLLDVGVKIGGAWVPKSVHQHGKIIEVYVPAVSNFGRVSVELVLKDGTTIASNTGITVQR